MLVSPRAGYNRAAEIGRMRRLVMEIPIQGLPSLREDSPFQMIRSLEVLLFLKHDQTGFAVISRMELASDGSEIDEVVNYLRGVHGFDIEVLSMDRGKSSYTLFMKGKLPGKLPGFDFRPARGYVTTPFEVKEGRLRLSFVGTVRELKGLLKGLETGGARYRVVALTDAQFSQDSPLSLLTEKQRRVLLTAYNLGYYDRPRRISSLELARQLGLASSTLVAHRQKAERRLLKAVLDKSRR